MLQRRKLLAELGQLELQRRGLGLALQLIFALAQLPTALVQAQKFRFLQVDHLPQQGHIEV